MRGKLGENDDQKGCGRGGIFPEKKSEQSVLHDGVVGILLLALAFDSLHLGPLLFTHHNLEQNGHHIAHQRHEEGQSTGAAHAEKHKKDEDDSIHGRAPLVVTRQCLDSEYHTSYPIGLNSATCHI